MLRRMPSLGALRAFEAAMRLNGLSGAARELSVTTSAISHQIRQLEQELGLKLVRRDGRRLVLTEAGERLMPALQEAFQRISSSVASLQSQASGAPLTISMLQNFAINWFLPRLHRFRERHPDIKVRVTVDSRYVDFAREPVDMAVRMAGTRSRNLDWQLLFQDELTAVCSPDYLERHGPFRAPAELLAHPLLVSQSRPVNAWAQWFASVGVDVPELPDALHLETSQLTVQAAANGTGFAIAGRRLMEPMLRRGAVIAPFAHTIAEHGSFYAVCPHAWSHVPKVRAMRNWLVEESGRCLSVPQHSVEKFNCVDGRGGARLNDK